MKRKNTLKTTIFDRLRPITIILASSLLLILFSVVISMITGNWLFLPIGLSMLLAEIAFFWLYGVFFSKHYSMDSQNHAILSGMTKDFLSELLEPVAITDTKGLIIWYNAAFQTACNGSGNLYHRNIQDLTEEKISITRLSGDTPAELKERPVIGILQEIEYDITSYKVLSEGNILLVTVWNSRERERSLEKELAEKNPIISYIAVDNYLEAASLLQGNYRTIAAKISVLLKEWANGLDGILREVENDRYMLITEEKHLKTITEKKFEILDEVREISRENTDIPVTISIGTACIDGTMPEKERAANQALEHALQRGGDQAVLKLRGNAVEYYGGRTKTVQKRTKIRSRIIASEVKNLISSASNVLIMGHRFADHDSIGSCIGMARFALEYCPRVNIVVNIHDANLKGVFKKLSGIADYKNMFLDGASAQERITSSTLLIITDVNNVRQFEAPNLFENCGNVVIVDHHRQSAEYAVKPNITYIEPNASSASELVAEMLEQQLSPGSILKEEAELLFAGIILDTKQFANNTGPRTFAAAHYLRSEGANPTEAQMLFRSDLDDFKREIKYEANAFIYRDIIAFSYMDENATQEDKIAASKAADKLLSLEGVLASFVLCRIDQTIHISARSSGTVNVQLITEKLHGGGHFDMAGAQVKDSTMKETFVQLKEAIDEYLNEL